MMFFDYLLLGLVALCVFLALRYTFRRRKEGKCVGCGGCATRSKFAARSECARKQEKD